MKTYGKQQVADGSAGTPSVGFTLDPDTGIWRPGTNRLGLATGGSARWEVDASGHLVPATTNAEDVGDATHSIRDLYVDGQIKGALGAAWSAFSPTFAGTGLTVGNGTASGSFAQLGKTVFWKASFTLGTTSSVGTGTTTCSLPVTADTAPLPSGNGVMRDNSAPQLYPAWWFLGTSTTVTIKNADGTNLSATSPFTWDTSDVINVSSVYEAA